MLGGQVSLPNLQHECLAATELNPQMLVLVALLSTVRKLVRQWPPTFSFGFL